MLDIAHIGDVMSGIALIAAALTFPASIGAVLIRIARVSSWLLIASAVAAAGARLPSEHAWRAGRLSGHRQQHRPHTLTTAKGPRGGYGPSFVSGTLSSMSPSPDVTR